MLACRMAPTTGAPPDETPPRPTPRPRSRPRWSTSGCAAGCGTPWCAQARARPLLALALSERPEVALQVHHDERSGAFLALGLGLATGRPAVVLTTSGTAAAEPTPPW